MTPTVGLTSVDFDISAHHYRHTLLGALQGRGLFVRMQRAILPAMVKASDLSGSSFADAAVGILTGLTSDVGLFDDLCNALAGKTALVAIDPTTGQERAVPLSSVFDQHFAGKYDEMVVWLVECIKANRLADFLSQEVLGRIFPAPTE